MVSMIYIDKIRDLIADFEDRTLALWSTLRAAKTTKVAKPSVVAPKRMSVANQWTALEDHLHSEMERAQSVLHMQDTATLHLDAAHYALDRIAVELVDVMPSIVTVATVQPPRIYTPLDRAEHTNAVLEQPIAA